MTKTCQQIWGEVGLWSKRNFGDNKSKAVPGLILGYLGSQMGLVEELGELFEGRDEDQTIDALGDILVYLCDWSFRLNFCPFDRWIYHRQGSSLTHMVIALGKLYHIDLKHHQGIRGYDEPLKVSRERLEQTWKLLDAIQSFTEENFRRTICSVLNEVWAKVSHRDWQKDAKTGGDVDAPKRPATPDQRYLKGKPIRLIVKGEPIACYECLTKEFAFDFLTDHSPEDRVAAFVCNTCGLKRYLAEESIQAVELVLPRRKKDDSPAKMEIREIIREILGENGIGLIDGETA